MQIRYKPVTESDYGNYLSQLQQRKQQKHHSKGKFGSKTLNFNQRKSHQKQRKYSNTYLHAHQPIYAPTQRSPFLCCPYPENSNKSFEDVTMIQSLHIISQNHRQKYEKKDEDLEVFVPQHPEYYVSQRMNYKEKVKNILNTDKFAKVKSNGSFDEQYPTQKNLKSFTTLDTSQEGWLNLTKQERMYILSLKLNLKRKKEQKQAVVSNPQNIQNKNPKCQEMFQTFGNLGLSLQQSRCRRQAVHEKIVESVNLRKTRTFLNINSLTLSTKQKTSAQKVKQDKQIQQTSKQS